MIELKPDRFNLDLLYFYRFKKINSTMMTLQGRKTFPVKSMLPIKMNLKYLHRHKQLAQNVKELNVCS